MVALIYEGGNSLLTVCCLAVQPPHKVNLTTPEKTVIVQLLKSSAALSVVAKHRELMRFNLKELSTTDEEQVKAARESKEKEKETQAAQANGTSNAAVEEHTTLTEAAEVPKSKDAQYQELDAEAGIEKADAQDAQKGPAAAEKDSPEDDKAEAEKVVQPDAS